MITLIIFKTIVLLFLLAVLGFFNGAETAITSLSSAYLRRAKENQIRNYQYIVFWETHTDEIITAMIVGMNLSVVGMGVISASLVLDIAEIYPQNAGILKLAVPMASIALALIFGNVFPKTLARYNAEKMGLSVLPFVVKFAKRIKFILRLLSGIANAIVRIFSKKRETLSVKADEIDFLLSNKSTSPLPADSRELVSNIMDFSERRISQVMVPRSEIFAVNIADKKEDIIKSIIENKYSRVPVYKGNLNNILGIIYSKDLAAAWRSSEIIVLEDLIRPAHYVPESAKINKMLKEFKTGHHHIAVVVDEFGSTIGIASIEDLLEEIVGEVWDEYDMKEKSAVEMDDGSYLIQANEPVLNVNNDLGLGIPEDDFTTVNGWILEIFGRIPEAGEKTIWKEWEIEIQDAGQKRVNRIILRKTVKS